MSRKKDQAGTFELLARLPQQIVSLAKAEYENAKRELVSKAKKAGIGAGAIVIALFFLFFMLEALVIAAIAALALVWPWWLAALVVAAGLLLLAALAILAGVALIKRGNPVPEETLGRVGDDISALSEVRVNSDSDAPVGSERRMPQAGGEGNWR
ncbi:phage holin family protein [Leucobacter zeae]|nr:phage holin family protein [Leucobacter zeae]